MTKRFRQDNTEGCYSDDELAEMNEAFERSVKLRLGTDDEIGCLAKSMQDYLSEEVQFAFDQGLRGDALVR